MVISSYQKSANPSRSRRKNLSRNEKSNDTTNENRLCRRLADTRDLKSLSGNRVRVRPLSTTCEISKSTADSNDSGGCFFLVLVVAMRKNNTKQKPGTFLSHNSSEKGSGFCAMSFGRLFCNNLAWPYHLTRLHSRRRNWYRSACAF